MQSRPPAVDALGIDLVHFGVVAAAKKAIGRVTRGVNVFVVCGVARFLMREIATAVALDGAAQLFAPLVVSLPPGLSLRLPDVME